MAEQRAQGFEILGMPLEVRRRRKMSKLVWRHLDADVCRDRFADLVRERLLMFVDPTLRYE